MTTADANIGSIMGIGFPPYTGGSAQYIVGYEGAGGTRQAGLRGPRQGTGRALRRPLHPTAITDLARPLPRVPRIGNFRRLLRNGSRQSRRQWPTLVMVTKRTALADFLRARRGLVSPTDVGLSGGDRRRVAGLRREEVAVLAGISTEYYVRLEQGREHNPSHQGTCRNRPSS